MSLRQLLFAVLIPHSALLTTGTAQATPSDELARERAAFAGWLATSPVSPLAAVALQPIGRGITLGPEGSDVVLPGVAAARIVEERGMVVLRRGTERRVLPREQRFTMGDHHLVPAGPAGRGVMVAFGPARRGTIPKWFGSDPSLVLAGRLAPPERHGGFHTLALDGVETESTEAGLLELAIGSAMVRLRVYRLPDPDTREPQLLIFFRDATNGAGTYPAGRFVEILPTEQRGWYRVDFNRARNPFCAYNTVFPCPAPWPGNVIPVAVHAGEKYVRSDE